MIRAATIPDAAAIARLSSQLGYQSSPEDIEVRLRDVLDRPGAVLVAEDEGEVVGWLHVLGNHTIETAPFALILGLVVDETRRSRGIGASLIQAAAEWATEHGYDTLRVRSNVVRERAHAFYERLGFSRAKSQVVFVKELDSRDAPTSATSALALAGDLAGSLEGPGGLSTKRSTSRTSDTDADR